jgi:hypothetical protein
MQIYKYNKTKSSYTLTQTITGYFYYIRIATLNYRIVAMRKNGTNNELVIF